MTESAASKLTKLCTAVAAVGAMVGLIVNSGAPSDSVPTSSASAASVAVVQIAN
ncbi:MAG TPA: hypothetical protein VL595_27090 [Pseudonocardia sp.]|jgi:hypothetical protein|nr:hypothetical protein [Pseudonocardia sp.]